MKYPRLVLSLKKAELNAQRLKSAADSIFVGRNVHLYYALKANYHPKILSTLFAYGIGAEVGTLHELTMLNETVPHKIIVNGHFKSPALLEEAVRRGVDRIYVESLDELERVEKIANSLSRNVQVGVRIKISAKKKVGADNSEIQKIALFSSHLVSLTSLHFHLGWNEKSVDVAEQALAYLLDGESILSAAGHPISVLNFGGSFAEPNTDPSQVFKRLSLFASRLPKGIRTIELEPGRYYVGDCGILYAQIEEVRGHHVILNTCAYGYRLTGATPDVSILSVGSRMSFKGPCLVLSGHWASENDIFELSNVSKLPRVGDIVRFKNFGAYVDTWFDQIFLDSPIHYELSHPYDRLFESLEKNRPGAGSILRRHWDYSCDELHSLPSSLKERKELVSAIKNWLLESPPKQNLEHALRIIYADYSTLRRELK